MAGIEALRDLASDRRHLDPVRFAHLRRELGLTRLIQRGEARASS
jgi:hypothetical protein